ARIDTALAACTGDKCSKETRAGLLRDRGSLQILRGQTDAGTATLGEALRLSPNIALDDTYATAEVRRAFQDAHGEDEKPLVQPPPGDFAFVPITEGADDTPIPIYVEFAESSPPARVVVKYRNATMSSYKTLGLPKMLNGWGGLIPCGDVKVGVFRYYVQGFDADNEPIVNSGDPKHPFLIRVRTEMSGPPPSLPSKPPPAKCGAETTTPETGGEENVETTPKLEDGTKCQNDDECASGSCSDGVCSSELRSRNRYAHLWLGVSGSIDFEPMPSGNDVCMLTPQAAPVDSSFYCTTPDGNDFPSRSVAAENKSLTAGNAGSVGGGLQGGNVRIVASLDYAISQNLMVGARIGFVLDTYPGSAAKSEGHAFFAPVHFEARGTYIFGSDPLQRTGFRPLVLVNAGLAEFDEDTTVTLQQTGIAGSRPIQAWHFGGPFFVGAGAGVRYAISPYHAFITALKIEGAFGSSGFMPVVSPEIGAQLGF
ncbi:MAG: hypothetical protein ACRELY_01920, partial [Polyangiaceae bacterium]